MTLKVEEKTIEPGNGTRYWIIVGHGGNFSTPFVTLPDFKVGATMGWYGYTDIGYVREKLTNLSIPDARVVSIILTNWEKSIPEIIAAIKEASAVLQGGEV